MGGIPDEHVEWAIVNRLKAMLEKPPETKFNVTQTFAVFSSILLWTKNRAWMPRGTVESAADEAAVKLRENLRQQSIMEDPWRLSRSLPEWRQGSFASNTDIAEFINGNFEGMSAEAFFEWLRIALAHGDGRTIRPLHKPSRDYSREWLAGIRVEFRRDKKGEVLRRLTLTEPDMKRLGAALADQFCAALAGSANYMNEDVATRVLEVAA